MNKKQWIVTCKETWSATVEYVVEGENEEDARKNVEEGMVSCERSPAETEVLDCEILEIEINE